MAELSKAVKMFLESAQMPLAAKALVDRFSELAQRYFVWAPEMTVAS